MGAYDSYFTGEITITPPLTWAEIRDTRQPSLKDLRMYLHEETTHTDDGISTVITGVALVPLYASPYSGYEMEAEVQAVVDAHPGHEFAGTITARPEDPDGLPRRYVVRDRRAVREVPRLVWPDGDQVAEQR